LSSRRAFVSRRGLYYRPFTPLIPAAAGAAVGVGAYGFPRAHWLNVALRAASQSPGTAGRAPPPAAAPSLLVSLPASMPPLSPPTPPPAAATAADAEAESKHAAGSSAMTETAKPFAPAPPSAEPPAWAARTAVAALVGAFGLTPPQPMTPTTPTALPLELLGLCGRLAAAISRHAQCPYGALLRAHAVLLPRRPRSAPAPSAPVATSMGDMDHVPAAATAALAPAAPPPALLLRELMALWTPRAAAGSFLTAVLSRLLGAAFWGTRRAAEAAEARLVAVALRGRLEAVTSADLARGVPLHEVTWLPAAREAMLNTARRAHRHGAGKGAGPGASRTVFRHVHKKPVQLGNTWRDAARTSQQLLCVVQTFLLRAIVVPLLRHHFYVADADAAVCGSSIVLYHRSVWLAVLRCVSRPAPASAADSAGAASDATLADDAALVGTGDSTDAMYEAMTPDAVYALLRDRADPDATPAAAAAAGVTLCAGGVNAEAVPVADLDRLGRALARRAAAGKASSVAPLLGFAALTLRVLF
jgi:hypothetical protein